jgi:hypothetical protein
LVGEVAFGLAHLGLGRPDAGLALIARGAGGDLEVKQPYGFVAEAIRDSQLEERLHVEKL